MATPDLLPISASQQERALALSMARLSALPLLIDTLWNSETCPESLLPWLAWSLSVDAWETNWPASQKREAIRHSVLQHLKKGTCGAVKQVLALLGGHLQLSEWFAHEGAAHTFALSARIDTSMLAQDKCLFDATFYRGLHKHLETVKPLRSHYQLTLTADFTQGLALATTLRAHTMVVAQMQFIEGGNHAG
jgi:phage tail P2-like protein